METQRNRATQLEQLFQQQVNHLPSTPLPPPAPPDSCTHSWFPLLTCIGVIAVTDRGLQGSAVFAVVGYSK